MLSQKRYLWSNEIKCRMMDKVSESSDTSEGAHIEKTKEKSHFFKDGDIY